jgi:hypothetical protein
MDMVFHAADQKTFASKVPCNCGKIRMKFVAYFGL